MYINIIAKLLFSGLVCMPMIALGMESSGDTNKDRIYLIDGKCAQLSICLKKIEQKQKELEFIEVDSKRYDERTEEVKNKTHKELLACKKEQAELIQFLGVGAPKL